MNADTKAGSSRQVGLAFMGALLIPFFQHCCHVQLDNEQVLDLMAFAALALHSAQVGAAKVWEVWLRYHPFPTQAPGGPQK